MSRTDQYRQRAEDADRAAATAPGPLEREAYERLAKGWRDLEATARMSEKRGA